MTTPRPWYAQALDKLNTPTETEQARARDQPAEATIDETRLKQMAVYEQELFERATVKWWPSRAERETLKLIRTHSLEVRSYYEERIIQRRMDCLREKDRQAYWQSIQPDVTPTLRERMERFFKGEVGQERKR